MSANPGEGRRGLAPPRSGPPAEDPRTPYRILVTILLVSSALGFLLATVPGPEDAIRGYDLVAATIAALMAPALWFLGPRLADDLALDIGIVASLVVVIVGALLVQRPEGQIIIGMALMLLGVYAASFRPPGRLAVLLGLVTVSYLVAVVVNRQLDSLVFALAVLVVIDGISIMVARLANQLRALALRDPLTGALNRRGLELFATPLAAGAARTGDAISVGLLDLDHFKVYNDTHGHLAGDRLLIELTDAWSAGLRATDLLARYGGDEFALVLPATTTEEAEELADRLRLRHDAPWSAGFVVWKPDEDLYTALDRADSQLLRLKEQPH